MARRRFFVDSIHNGTAELTGGDAHHLARVLRAEAGRQYEISDGATVWLAEVVEADGGRVVFRAVEPVAAARAPLNLTLCAALVKFDRFEWMIEKATELGVACIVAFAAARTERGLLEAAAKRVERWRKIARESAQQARRLAPPVIEVARAWPTAPPLAYLLDEEAGAPPLLSRPPARCNAAAVLAGPEGGWTAEERARAVSQGWTAVSLGPHILRAETAAIAATAVLMAAAAAIPIE